MAKNLVVMWFILSFLLIVVAFYVGFAWDTLAIAGATTRAIREFTFPPSFNATTSSSGTTTTTNV
jgi:hypothetical protein